MVQEMVPDTLRGRVMSLYSLMFTGVMPFASLLVTWLADAMGMRRELQIAAIVYGVVAQLLMWQLRGVTRNE
jgi:MFS-type transporter involved in bile tolerance (Atg22 family)